MTDAALTAFAHDSMPFAAELGLTIESGGAAQVVGRAKTNFLRGVTDGDITITATPLHVGRTTIVVVTDITRADGKVVTRTTQTQAVLPRS